MRLSQGKEPKRLRQFCGSGRRWGRGGEPCRMNQSRVLTPWSVGGTGMGVRVDPVFPTHFALWLSFFWAGNRLLRRLRG